MRCGMMVCARTLGGAVPAWMPGRGVRVLYVSSLSLFRVCVPRGLLEMLCWDDVVSARGVRPQWGPPFLCSARRSYGDSGAGAHGRVSQCACRA